MYFLIQVQKEPESTVRGAPDSVHSNFMGPFQAVHFCEIRGQIPLRHENRRSGAGAICCEVHFNKYFRNKIQFIGLLYYTSPVHRHSVCIRHRILRWENGGKGEK